MGGEFHECATPRALEASTLPEKEAREARALGETVRGHVGDGGDWVSKQELQRT